MLPYFFCYGIERPLLWDFPTMPTGKKGYPMAKYNTLFALLAGIPHDLMEKDGEQVHHYDCLRCHLELSVTEIQRQVRNQTHFLVQGIDQEIGAIVDERPKRKAG